MAVESGKSSSKQCFEGSMLYVMYVKGYVCTIQTSNVACLSYQHQSYQPSCQPMGRRRLSGLVRVGGLLIVLCLANRFPWAQSAAKSAAPVTSTSKDERVLRRYQRHDGRLDGLLKRIKRPRLEFFESGGVKYWLPLSAEDAVVEGCSEDELAYLSGFSMEMGVWPVAQMEQSTSKSGNPLKGGTHCSGSKELSVAESIAKLMVVALRSP